MTYEVEINPDSWTFFVLDQGYNEWVQRAGDTERRKYVIMDQDGQPLQRPALLDGIGNQLDPEADPVFNGHKMYKERDF